MTPMPASRHSKYAPPVPLEAPADLAALVEAHLACEPGREWGRSLLRLYEYGVSRRVRMHQVFVVGEVIVTLSDSLPKISRRPDGFNPRKER